MFDTVKRWAYYWKLSKKVKANLKKQIEQSRARGTYDPPTPEEVEKFKKDMDMGWDSHMVQRVESRRTYFEASLN